MGFFRKLRYRAARRRFQLMVAFWDEQIEQARKAHKPVKPIMAAKQRWLHDVMGQRG